MPSIRIGSFITAIFAVSLISHYFFYYSFTRFFRITDAPRRHFLMGVFIFLSVSFIIATFVAHSYENAFTRAFYFGTGFWLGLLVNLMMACLAGWLATWATRLAGHSPNTVIIGSMVFGMALLYSVYGVWNASNPRVTNVNISIRNLPDGWEGRTIVQLSDVHLGHVYKTDFLKKVVDKVNSLHPDMVVITGDLFDGMDGKLSEMVGPLDDLQAPDGVYFITGNHETYLGVDEAFAALGKTKVTILNDEVRDIGGLQLVGISYPKRGQNIDLYKTITSLKGFVKGKPTILLYHAPLHIDEARRAGVNLQLSGHTHKGQIFPVVFITDMVYKQYAYGLHKIGDYSIYTTDGVGTWGPPMRTGNSPEIVDIHLSKAHE